MALKRAIPIEEEAISEPSSFGFTRSWGEPTLKEKALRVLPDIGTGLVSNISATPSNVVSSVKSYFDYVADKYAREYPGMVELELKKQKEYLSPDELKRGQEFNRRFYKSLSKNTKALKMHVPDEQAQRFATKFGSGLASIGKGFIPGLIAVEVWGSSFDQARNQGKTDDQAASYAGTQALVQELGERLGSFALTKIFKNSGTILTRAGKSFLSEGTQEGTQEAMAIAIEKAYGVKDGSPKFKRIIEAFGIGGLTGATVSLAASPFTAQSPIKEEIPIDTGLIIEDKNIQEKTKDLPRIDEGKPIREPRKAIPIEEETPILREPRKAIPIEEDMPIVKPKKAIPIKEKKIIKDVITEKDIRQRVKDLRIERKEAMPIKFKEFYKQGVKIPEGMESDYKEILKKHKIKINKKGIALDTAVQEFSKENGTSEDLNTFMDELDKSSAVDLSTPALKEEVTKGIDDRVEVLKTKAQASRMAINKAFKDKTQSQQEIKQSIIDYAKTNLVLKDRGKLLSTVKNAKTEKNLETAVGMMNQFAEKTNKSNIKTKIFKELKGVSLRKKPQVPKGKFTPETQSALNAIKTASKKTKIEASNLLAKNLKEDAFSFERAMENVMLNVKARYEAMSSTELQEVLDNIQSLKETGKSVQFQEIQARKEDLQKKTRTAINVVKNTVGKQETKTFVNGEEIIKPVEPVTRKDAGGSIKNKLKALGKTQVGWRGLVDLISFNDESSPYEESELSKISDVSTVESNEKRDFDKQIKTIVNAYSKAYNIPEKKVVSQMGKDSKVILKIGKLELTKAQIRNRWMEFQDPTLDETFEKMGYTQTIQNKINDAMLPSDKKFANSLFEFYDKYHPRINEVYKRKHFINLTKRENNYKPIQREGYKVEPGTAEFIEEDKYRVSIESGSMQDRVDSILPLKQSSDIDIVLSHINDMEHFIAWSDKLTELNSIYRNPEFKAAVADNYGNSVNRFLIRKIDEMTRGKADLSNYLGWLDRIRANFSVSVLGGFKFPSALKQIPSFLAYMEKVPTVDFMAGLIDYTFNFKKAEKILQQSDEFRLRRKNISMDIKDVDRRQALAAFRKSPDLKNMYLILLKFGDSFAIRLGGWSLYKYERKQDKSHKEALKSFDKQTIATQQTANISEQSYWQTQSSLTKMLALFSSGQNALFRRELITFKGLFSGRMSKKQIAKNIAIYHFAIPMMIQFVASGLKWDDEDQSIAALTGSLNGIFIMKDLLMFIVNKVYGKRSFGFEAAPYDIIYEIGDAITDLKVEDIGVADVLAALKHLSVASGELTGHPVKELYNKYAGIKKLSDGDTGKGILRLLGYSEYALKDKNKPKKGKIRR